MTLDPEASQNIVINATYRASEEVKRLLEQRPDLTQQVRSILADGGITNKEAFTQIGQLLQWELDTELYLRDNSGYTLAEGVIAQLRKSLLSSEQVEGRYQYTEAELDLIQQAFDNLSLRGERNARNYQKMTKWLKKQNSAAFTDLTPNSLKVTFTYWQIRGRLKDNFPLKTLSEDDIPLLQIAITDPNYYTKAGGYDYDKLRTLLDPNKTREISNDSLWRYIDLHLPDVTRPISYGEKLLNANDIPSIQRMLSDEGKKYYLPSGERNYELMISVLDPTGERGVNKQKLQNYISEKLKAGLLVENRSESFDLSYEKDFPVIAKHLENGGRLSSEEMVALLDPDGKRNLTTRRIAKFYQRWQGRAESK